MTRAGWRLVAALLGLTAVIALFTAPDMPTARGKTPARPLPNTLSPLQQTAQDVALSDPRVQLLTLGRDAEVFGVLPVGDHFPAGVDCGDSACRRVELYRFADNTAVTVIVNTRTQQVVDVVVLPNAQPGINRQQAQRALDIALNAPEVAAELGFTPTAVDMAPVAASLGGTACETGHLCAGPTFRVGNRVLWAVVDLTVGELAGVNWTEVAADGAFVRERPLVTCPAPGAVARDGWTLSYETTNTDGLRVYDVAFNGRTVLTSASLPEWHVDYNGTYTFSGFVDITGCSVSSGFVILPYGETAVLDLIENNAVVGFEVVQDFRMLEWGASCNYRYEQRYQFFSDGRFRVVAGAYGRGCGEFPMYRAVVRLDIAVNGDAGDVFAGWDGARWQVADTEAILLPSAPLTADGVVGWVLDGGTGYAIVPGAGQFGDNGRGDDPYLYVTRYAAAEGAFDLPNIGTCCNDDAQQGPHRFVNGETVAGENLVLWYVPQFQTDVDLSDGDGLYCWTVNGEPTPEAYPCFGGPMFVPFALEERLFLPLITDPAN